MKQQTVQGFQRLDDDSNSAFLLVADAVWLHGKARQGRREASAAGFRAPDGFVRSGSGLPLAREAFESKLRALAARGSRRACAPHCGRSHKACRS
jgi:hypothetical protein